MGISSAIVKKTARTALKNNYLKGIISSSVYAFVWIVCIVCAEILSSVAGTVIGILFFGLLCVFLLLPLNFGYIYFGVRTIFSADGEPLMLFYGFSGKAQYKKFLKLSAFFVGKTVITGALLLIPAFITDIIASGKIFMMLNVKIPIWASGFGTVSGILRTAAFICLLFVMFKYYLAPFLIAADENMDPLNAINFSKTIHSKTGKDFVWLILSFTPYIIACFFLVPLIFIFPYFNISYAVHCRFAVAEYNKKVDLLNRKDIPTFNADTNI